MLAMAPTSPTWLADWLWHRRTPERTADLLEGIQGALGEIVGAIEQLELRLAGTSSESEDPRIAAIETKVRDLTLALSDGVQRVQRSENRVRAIVKSARQELRDAGFEHPGVEAEASELRQVDGDDRVEEPLSALPADVDAAGRKPSAVPGVSVRQMRVARARRR